MEISLGISDDFSRITWGTINVDDNYWILFMEVYRI